MAPTIEQLEAMSDEEVRAAYNENTLNTVVGLEWFREELHWRATDRRNRNIERLTFASRAARFPAYASGSSTSSSDGRAPPAFGSNPAGHLVSES
jgi:hypothetical protein